MHSALSLLSLSVLSLCLCGPVRAWLLPAPPYATVLGSRRGPLSAMTARSPRTALACVFFSCLSPTSRSRVKIDTCASLHQCKHTSGASHEALLERSQRAGGQIWRRTRGGGERKERAAIAQGRPRRDQTRERPRCALSPVSFSLPTVSVPLTGALALRAGHCCRCRGADQRRGMRRWTTTNPARRMRSSSETHDSEDVSTTTQRSPRTRSGSPQQNSHAACPSQRTHSTNPPARMQPRPLLLLRLPPLPLLR